jgi:PE-PPE domain
MHGVTFPVASGTLCPTLYLTDEWRPANPTAPTELCGSELIDLLTAALPLCDRCHMHKAIRVVGLFVLGLLSTAVLGAVTALMAAVSLAATALIVPGTGTPNANIVGNYLENFRDYYMQDTPCNSDDNCGPFNPGDPDNRGLQGINYFASFWPIPLPGWCDPGRCEKFDDSVDDGVTNLGAALQAIADLEPDYTGDIVIAGYSQGGRVVTIAKTQFANGDWDELVDQVGEVEFVFIGNPNRPNGGLLSRLGILGTIPILEVTTGQPTPTNTEFRTEDWAIRWEGIADFPLYLGNPLAVANSLLGFYYDHGTYLAINEGSDPGELPAGYDVDTWRAITANPELYPDIVDIQTFGDTTYYTVTPKVLPLVRPLHSIPLIGKPIADLIEPALRVIIEETGYNRNIPFGQPTEIQLVPVFNPVSLAVKLIPAIFQGINNFLANFGLATEIPLSPTTPVSPVSPLADQQDQQEDELEEQATLLNQVDDSSRARLALVQDDADLEQQQRWVGAEGDVNLLATNNELEEDLTLSVGNETPITGGTTEPEQTVVDSAEETAVDSAAATAAAKKAEREAAMAERQAQREAAKAEREAKREAAKAEREAQREKAAAERQAQREAARAEREADKDAAESDTDSDTSQAAAA